MPKLPRISQRLSPLQTVGGRPPQAQPVSNAQGQQAIGSAISQIGQFAGEILQKKAVQAEQSNLVAQLADYETKQDIRLKEAARGAIPNDVSGMLENPAGDKWDNEFVEGFNKGLEDIGGNLVTPQGRLQFAQAKANLTAKYNRDLALNRQAIAGKKAQLKVNSTLNSRLIAVGNNPENLREEFAKFSNDMETMASLGSFSQIEKEELLEDAKFKFGAQGVQALIRKNPSNALARLKAKEFDDMLLANQKNTLLNQAGAQVKAATNHAANLEKMRIEKPFEYSAAIGRPIPALGIDIRSGTFGSEELTKLVERMGHIKKAKQETGIVEMDLLSPLEIKDMVQKIGAMNEDQAINFFNQFSTATSGLVVEGREARAAFAKAVFKEDGGLAVSLLTAGTNERGSRDILKGRRIAEAVSKGNLKAIGIPKMNQVNAVLDPILGDTFLNGNPETRAAYKTAIYHAYITEGLRQGLVLTDEPDPDVLARVSDFILPMVQVNGKRIPSLAVNGVTLDQDDYTEFLDSVTDEHFLKTQGSFPIAKNGEEIKGDALVRFLNGGGANSAQFEVERNGVYLFENGFKDSAQMTPFVFDMNKYVEDFNLNKEERKERSRTIRLQKRKLRTRGAGLPQ
jgi:hypothetical protein